MSADKLMSTDNKKIFEKKIKSLQKINNLNFIDYEILYKYHISCSSFAIAAKYRSLLSLAYLDYLKSTNFLFNNTLISIFEVLNENDILKLIKSKNTRFVCPNTLQNICALCNLFLGHKNESLKVLTKKYDQKDFKYCEILNNKSIAVVGPATPYESCGQEIDSFDFIIRPIFNKNESFDINQFGSQTHISYYNYGFLINAKNDLLEASKVLNWVNIKNISTIDNLEEIRSNHRRFFYVDDIYSKGSGNSIPNIIYDLVHFNPKKVKLFCSNFYTSILVYDINFSKIYKSRKNVNSLKRVRLHDPFSQFLFIKKMFEHNIIDADYNASNILKLNIDEYAKRLDHVDKHK